MSAGFVCKEPRTGFLGQLGCHVLMPNMDLALASGLKLVLALLAASNSLKAEFPEKVLYFCTRRNILLRITHDLSKGSVYQQSLLFTFSLGMYFVYQYSIKDSLHATDDCH